MPATPMQAVNLNLGAGTLYSAPVGSTEPIDNAAAWAAAWIKVGYTSEGHTFNYELTTEDIYVAEEIEPVLAENTKLAVGIQFAMAEITVASLKLAFNGGTASTGAASTTFTPPAATAKPGEVALGWESRSGDERWIIRRAVQTKAVEIKRMKPPAYATIPVAFKALKPSSGSSFVAIVLNARG